MSSVGLAMGRVSYWTIPDSMRTRQSNSQFFTDLKSNAVLAKTVTSGRRGEDGMATLEMMAE